MESDVVFVTGAAGGIGRAICERLAGAGDVVIAADLKQRDAIEGAEAFVTCDVTQTDSVTHAIREASAIGRITRVVTAAGVVDEAPVHEMSDEQWHRVVSVSLDGTFKTLRATLPSLREAGGVIVSLSSGWAAQGYPDGAHYAAAKAGVEALVRSVARGYAADGVRANAVAPGPIETPMLWDLPGYDERKADRAARIPMGRVGEPAEVAAAVAWLLSPESSYVNGQVLHVSGGLVV